MGGPTGRGESIPPEGWYDDPTARHQHRWYSLGWPTDLVRDGNVTGRDPLAAADADALTTPAADAGDRSADVRPTDLPALTRWSGGTVGASGHLSSVDPVRALAPVRVSVLLAVEALWTALGIWGDKVAVTFAGGVALIVTGWWAGRRWARDRAVARFQRRAGREADGRS